ncbi:hypothetical protein [Streptomyces sp. NPDC058084]|uniref:hypothetical protein n=1 Tax=Streptomyces sp. NPDC058084 TaxID=3346333 RepID=UPI0036EA978E
MSPPSAPEHQVVAVAEAGGDARLGDDTLHYALGSQGADHGVPCVVEHAFDVAARPFALCPNGRIAAVRGIAASDRFLRLNEGWREYVPDPPLVAEW